MGSAEESSFENIFNRACSRLKSNGEVEKTSKFFSALTIDIERYNFVESLFEKLELYNDKSTETEKSATKSCMLREEGNEKFKRKHDLQALTLYTQSILFAPPDSTMLALAYGNRSAVLKSLNKFEDCIKDIERAMTLKFPENLVYKLLVRQGECLKAVGKMEEAIKTFLRAQKKLKVAGLNEERLTEQIKLISNMILKCKNCKTVMPGGEEVHNRTKTPITSYGINKEITCASSCVRIEYSPYIGRHLCATQDIMPGDTIIVEQPYAWVLLPEYMTTHCTFCLQRCASLIPCVNCINVMFCSVDCMAAAEAKFHGFECSALSSILKLDMGKMSLLAVRIVSVAGLHYLSEFLPVDCVQNEIKTNEQKRSLGFNSAGKYDSSDLLPIFNLISNSEMRSVSDLFKRSMMAACLVKCLGLKSCKETSLIGSFLLRLLQSLPCNAHEISETIDSDEEKVPINLEIGAAAYACLSLLNHSCDPNVVRHSHGDTAVLRAIKFIPKGQQILDNYGYHFAVHSRESRQSHLQSQYLFACACDACSNSWPLHQNLSPAPIVPGSVDLMVRQSSSAIQPIIQRSLNGEDSTEKDVDEIFKHLRVLDENEGRLCQEFNCCQEIIKQYFAKKGNFYSSLC